MFVCYVFQGTLDPSLFEGSLVKAAKDHRAPFLQCRKYFHTISMSQLQGQCVSVCLPACLPACLPICLSVCLCLSDHESFLQY